MNRHKEGIKAGAAREETPRAPSYVFGPIERALYAGLPAEGVPLEVMLEVYKLDNNANALGPKIPGWRK